MREMRFASLFLFLCSLASLHAQNPVLDSLLNQLHNHKSEDIVRANLLHSIGFKYYTIDVDQTMLYADRLESLALKLNYDRGLINAYNLKGLFYDSKGDYPRALEFYKKALNRAVLSENKGGMSMAYNNMGMIYEITGEYPKALDYYQKSLKIDEELNDSSGVANSYMQLGNIHELLGDTAKAMQYYTQSKEMAERLGDKMLMIYSSMNIGYILENQSFMEEAYDVFLKALQLSEEILEQEAILLSSMMMGIINCDLEEYGESEYYLTRALKLSRDLGSTTHERYVNHHLGELYFKKGNYAKAYDFCLKVLHLDEEEWDDSLLSSCTELLSEICAARGMYREAYEYHVKHKKLQDSLFTKENYRKIADLEYKLLYENEKQKIELEQQQKNLISEAKLERQKVKQQYFIIMIGLLLIIIVFIIRNNFLRKSANKKLQEQKDQVQRIADELKRANSTKDKFFSIIAHDLKGPFGTLSSLIGQFIENYDEMTDHDRLEYLKTADKAGKNTYNLLLNLLEWSRLQRGTIKYMPTEFNLNESLDQIVYLFKEKASMKDQALKCRSEVNFIVKTDPSILSAILRNLVGNALKFTPRGGTVDVLAEKRDDGIRIMVRDNGIGIPAKAIAKLFSIENEYQSKGTDNEYGTGLGLVLCKEFVSLLGGSIRVQSQENEGSTFIVDLPAVLSD